MINKEVETLANVMCIECGKEMLKLWALSQTYVPGRETERQRLDRFNPWVRMMNCTGKGHTGRGIDNGTGFNQ